MATIKIDTFGGISPRTHPTLLADGMAVTAHNCRLETGKLVPIREPSLASISGETYLENGCAKISDAKSMHIWRKKDGVSFDMLLFPGVTWVAEGNVADDSLTRLIVSGETGTHEGIGASGATGSRMHDPVVYLRDPNNGNEKVVVPICKTALKAPVVERVSAGDLGDNRRYTRFFVTWVDRWQMESPVSEASLVKDDSGNRDEDLEYNDGDQVKIFIEELSADKGRVEQIRVYKVITGVEEGRVQFVAEFNGDDVVAANGYINIWVKDENAGEILTEIESPPEDLRCIRNVPGGFYCGISPSNPKTVFFSEVDLLYSWPMAYRYDVKDNVVALAVSGNTVYALTNGNPCILSGTSPESMTVTEMGTPAACVSPKGVCVCQNAVYFASNEGLMYIGGSDAGTVCKNLTQRIFTRDQWEALNPKSCLIGQHGGVLHLFFASDDGEKHYGYVINLLESGKIAVTTHNEVAACLCEDDVTGKMYYIRKAE